MVLLHYLLDTQAGAVSNEDEYWNIEVARPACAVVESMIEDYFFGPSSVVNGQKYDRFNQRAKKNQFLFRLLWLVED